MSAWRRIFGLDVVNTALVALGSIFTVIFVSELTHSDALSLGAALLCIGGFGLLRHYGLKALPREEEEGSGGWRVAELESRVAELEELQARMAELEERVDFSERMLARQAETPKLEAPKS